MSTLRREIIRLHFSEGGVWRNLWTNLKTIRGVECGCQEVPKSVPQTRVLEGLGRPLTSQWDRATSEG